MQDQASFSLGVIADVQHAPAANGWDFHRTQERHYRHSRAALASAVGELLLQRCLDEDQQFSRRRQIRQYAQGFSWDRTSEDQLKLFHALTRAGNGAAA